MRRESQRQIILEPRPLLWPRLLTRRRLLAPLELAYTVLAGAVLWFGLVLFLPVGWFAGLRHHRDSQTGWHHVFQWLMEQYFFLAGVRIVVERAQYLPGPSQLAVFASNHMSHLDAMLLDAALRARSLPRSFALTMPHAAFPWPFGLWLHRSGMLEIARDEAEHRRYPKLARGERVVQIAAGRLRPERKHIFLFPEGHIERKRALLKFHTGAVRIALQAGVPIVPMTLRSVDRVLSPHRFLLWPGTVVVRIHQPLDLREWHGQQHNHALVRRLTERLKRVIVRDLPEVYRHHARA